MTLQKSRAPAERLVMTANLSIPWWVYAQGALVTGLVVAAVLGESRIGMTLAAIGLVLTFVSHDLRGRRR